MNIRVQQTQLEQLSGFVRDECQSRLRAYEAKPRDAAEHFETENEVLSGGYAYRQLYELVQNAADAILEAGEASSRICVRLAPDRLEAANTGAALDEKGIDALLNARSSSKRDNQIGGFGIGFKSLLKLGGRVDLTSRSVGLRFDPEACRDRIRRHLGLAADAPAPGMRLAEVLDPTTEDSPFSDTGKWNWATTVVSAEIADETAFDRLKKELADFPAEFLLFLPPDISLELEVDGAKPRLITKRFEDGLAVISDGTNETKWKVFETSVKIENPEARSDATHIQARDSVPLAWAVPLGGREQAGRFWAFFPTETNSRTSGILNAPWKLNSDRANLIQGPWNEAIMKAAAELIGDSLTALSTPEDHGAAVSAFPRRPDRRDEIAVPLIRSLWDRIAESDILPNVDGVPRRPCDLARHFIEDTGICKSWASLASDDARQYYLHPDCYSFDSRKSRLDALVSEAKNRGMSVLNKPPVEEWLDRIGNTEIASAKQSLAFFGDLLKKPYEYGIYNIPQAHLIPTPEGCLASPSRSMIVSGGPPPAGFFSVAEEIASDPKCREILVHQIKVKELKLDSWPHVLETSLKAAEASDEPEGWENFWRNIASCPSESRQGFVDELDGERVRFRTMSGKWMARSLLVVTEQISGIPEDHAMDPVFRRQVEAQIPKDWLAEFPCINESVDHDDPDMQDYLRWLSPHFDELCRAHSGSKPRYLPKFSTLSIPMPAGWRLVPLLPAASAAKLTVRVFDALAQITESWAKITIVHPTRADAYPKVTAPHPIYFWLIGRGRVRVGDLIVPLKCISLELAETLARPGICFEDIAGFLRARDQETDLQSHLTWHRSKLVPECSARFWEQVFTEIATKKTSFKDLRPVWELAYGDGAVPGTVPSAEGPLPLSEIYVTTDPSVEHDLDDGRIVLLSADAASAWSSAGARALGSGPSMSFETRLSTQSYLLDLFPELAAAQEEADSLANILVVWVAGLEETIGPYRYTRVVGMDVDGALIIDRHRFDSHGWAKSAELLLRCLARHGVIEGGASLEENLDRILDRRVYEARKAVRAEKSLERRLLKAVGGDVEVLLQVLTPATRQAVGDQVDTEGLARLTLAVHGPALLSKLRDALELQGLAPPKRWGGEQARAFVLDLGFSVEFASSIGGRRDAELSVSGPISLPPLHDYQKEILKSIGELLATGSGRRRAVISLPTGGGKTRVAAEAVVRLVLLREVGRRSALWIAQTDELCEQAVQCFRQLWVNMGEAGEDLRIVRLWGGQRNPLPPEGDEATVVIASIQTLNSRSSHPDLAWIAQSGIIIIDECHHAITSSYTDLLRWLDIQVGSERAREREAPVLGLSATPWRGYNEEESERLAARFDRRWFPADQTGLHEKLSRMGVLAERTYRPLRYERPITLTAREQQYVDTFGELPDSVVGRIGEDADRNDLIIDSILNSSADSVLLFANSVSHAQYLAARLHLKSCPAVAVSGQTDRLSRQYFTRRFRAGDLRVICNHSVLTTGFDAPKADMVLISRPVFSPVRYMQMVGRGLRGPVNGGTDHCEIATVEDNIVNFRDCLAYHFCKRFFDV